MAEIKEIIDLIETRPTNLDDMYLRYDERIIYGENNKETNVVPSTRLTGHIECIQWKGGDDCDYEDIVKFDKIVKRVCLKINKILKKLMDYYYDAYDIFLPPPVDSKAIEFITELSKSLLTFRGCSFLNLCSPCRKIDIDPNSVLPTHTFTESKNEMFDVVVLGRIFIIQHRLRRYSEAIQMIRYIKYDDVKDIIEERNKKSLNIDYTTEYIDEYQLQIDKEIFSLRKELDNTFNTYNSTYKPPFYAEYMHHKLQELGLPIDPPQPQPNPPTIPQDPPQTKTTTQQDPSQPEPQPQPTKEYPCIYRVHIDNYTLLLQDLKTAKIITEQNNKYKWNLTQKLFTYFCYTLRENKWLEVNRQNGIPWTKIASYYDVNKERLSTTFGDIIDKKTKKLKKISSLNSDKNKEVLDKVLEKYLNLGIL